MMPEVGQDGSARILQVLCNQNQIECDFLLLFFSSSLIIKLFNHVNICQYIYIFSWLAFNIFQYLFIILRQLYHYHKPSLSAPNPTLQLLNDIVLNLEEEFCLFRLFFLLESLELCSKTFIVYLNENEVIRCCHLIRRWCF